MTTHIRHERRTREMLNLVGSGTELENEPRARDACTTWCNITLHGFFFFQSIDHAALATTLSVCRHCIDDVIKALQDRSPR